MWNINNSSQINQKVDFVLFGGGELYYGSTISNLNNTGWMLDIRDDGYKNIKYLFYGGHRI